MPRNKLASTPDGIGIIRFCGHFNKILVLNLCPLESFYILAQDMEGECGVNQKRDRFWELTSFPDVWNVGLFSVLLFVCSRVRISVFSVFLREIPLGKGGSAIWIGT